jgi:hypothetical protein
MLIVFVLQARLLRGSFAVYEPVYPPHVSGTGEWLQRSLSSRLDRVARSDEGHHDILLVGGTGTEALVPSFEVRHIGTLDVHV